MKIFKNTIKKIKFTFSTLKKEEEESLKFIDDYVKSFENNQKLKNNQLSSLEESREKHLNAFYKMGLMGALCRNAIDNLKFSSPTEIQKKVIPFLLKERSVIASAETGTGKTAAYLLPILNKTHAYLKKKETGITSLILAPTKELSEQILTHLKDLSEYMEIKPKVLFVTGKKTLDYENPEIYNDVNIVIATPGKLLKLISKKMIDLSNVKNFVVDECDKMLSMGNLPDLLDIHQNLPRGMCVSMFSASIMPGLETFMRKLAPNHEYINLNESLSVAQPIKHIQYKLSHPRKKLKLLTYIIRRKSPIIRGSQVLIFARTKARAERICTELSRKYKTAVVHSGKTNSQRKRAILDFKKGDIQMLVSTEVLSRGIDIPTLKYVINFDVPAKPESYLHRVGRCGRMGKDGFAISFVSQTPQIIQFQRGATELNEEHLMKSIEKFLNQRIEWRKVPGPWKDHENLFKDTEEKLEIQQESRKKALEILEKKNPGMKESEKKGTYYTLKDLTRKKKLDEKIPSLRNFKEGRYEDVIESFDQKRAMKRNLITKK